jgi:hypothetical protein
MTNTETCTLLLVPAIVQLIILMHGNSHYIVLVFTHTRLCVWRQEVYKQVARGMYRCQPMTMTQLRLWNDSLGKTRVISGEKED